MARRADYSEYGMKIYKRMFDLKIARKEMVEMIHEKTGKYFDDYYFSKILQGKAQPPKIIQAINEILDLETA